MQLLAPDERPLTLRQRAKGAALATALLLTAAFFFWIAEPIGNGSWTINHRKHAYMNDWTPFWQGASFAITGSWLVAFALLGLWKSVRPFTPGAQCEPNRPEDR